MSSPPKDVREASIPLITNEGYINSRELKELAKAFVVDQNAEEDNNFELDDTILAGEIDQ